MGVLRTVIVALALSLAPASIAFGASSPLDDVGEEHFDFWDASDDPEQPEPVEMPGTYSALLQPPEDEDWYMLNRAGGWFPGDGMDPACAAVDFSGDVAASSHIWVPGTDGEYYATSDLAPLQDAVLALVVPAFTEVHFGVASEPILGMGPVHGSGSYDFTVDVHTIDELSEDPVPEDGLPSCLAPSLTSGETIELDFEVDTPSNFTFSVAEGAGVTVELETPDQESEPLLLKDDDSLIVNTDVEAGSHTLILENTGVETRAPLLGLTFGPDDDDDDDDEPKGRPCDPTC